MEEIIEVVPDTQLVARAKCGSGVEVKELDAETKCWLVAHLISEEGWNLTELSERLHCSRRTLTYYRSHPQTQLWLKVLELQNLTTKQSHQIASVETYTNTQESRHQVEMNRKNAQIDSLISSLKESREKNDLLVKKTKQLRGYLKALGRSA